MLNAIGNNVARSKEQTSANENIYLEIVMLIAELR